MGAYLIPCGSKEMRAIQKSFSQFFLPLSGAKLINGFPLQCLGRQV